MSLSLAYEIARGGLSANSISSSVVSRNIANVGNPDAARKTANVVNSADAGVYVSGIANAIDAALFESVVAGNARSSELSTIASALDRLENAVNDPELGLGPNALMDDLRSNLQAAAAAPQDDNAARSLLSSAQRASSGLNEASALVENVRTDADTALGQGVSRLTGLLDQFEVVNNEVINGSTLGRDVTDQIDRRNGLLREIAGLVDVHASVRGSNDMVLFVANGTTLFETVPRRISLESGATLLPGQPGGALRIDGIPFAGALGARLGGELGGNLQVRDVVAVSFGRQLDETARGLIEAFAETDQSTAPVAPALAGLFTYADGPALPPPGAIANGLARTIRVNANADPAQGGDLTLLRDGGISDPGNPAYDCNPADNAGYSDRLRALASALVTPRPFDALAGLGSETSVLGFAADSAGWLEGARQSNFTQLQQQQVLVERASGAWQSAVGVNLDEELTTLMALEKSYQASSRLITTVSSMFDALLEAAR